MTTTPPSVQARRVNRATMLPTGFKSALPSVSRSDLAGAFALATQLCSAQPWTTTAAGYRVFWVRGNRVSFRDVTAMPSDYLVVGRHSECDLVLADDPEISLRHLLARATILDDGGVALRLFDLHTNLPMFLEDGVPRQSMLATGALVLRVGSYILGALPFGPRLRTLDLGPYRSPPPYLVCEARSVPKRSGEIPRITHITSLPPVGEFVASAPARGVRISLGSQGRGTSIIVDDEALELGVLLGRAPKCLDAGLHAVLNPSISRAHLLLLREGEMTQAFDLCSVQGTYHEGMRIRRCELSAQGTRLELAAYQPVTFLWHGRVLH